MCEGDRQQSTTFTRFHGVAYFTVYGKMGEHPYLAFYHADTLFFKLIAGHAQECFVY